jgi:subtilisin family serine protease
MNQFGDPRVKVAFVATGLDYTHPDLVGKVNLDLSRSFVPEDDVLLEQLFPGAHPVAELGFHATHIASSLTCNLSILACIAPDVDLIGVKVLNKDEFGTIGDVVAGIKYAADIRSHVIALPFAMWAPSYDQWDKVWNWGNPEDRADIIAMIRAIAYAKLKGSVVIADASVPFFLYGIDADADGLDVILPAQAGATTVGCTGSDDTWCNISNYGFTLIDIAAPGGLVPVVPNPPPTTFPPEELVWGACSSFSQFGRLPDECASENQPQYLAILGPQPAVGHAAGVAALIASRYHGFAHGFFVNWKLLRTAVDIETPGRDAYSGWGRVDAYRGLTQ